MPNNPDVLNNLAYMLAEADMRLADALDYAKRACEARQNDPLKGWKMTDEDWRNRSKREAYEEAINDMLAKTDTELAPWQVIAGESKRFSRVAVLEALNAEIERGIRAFGLEPPASEGLDYGV